MKIVVVLKKHRHGLIKFVKRQVSLEIHDILLSMVMTL